MEGMEGSGKSTLIKNVSDLIDDAGISFISTRHPGSTPLGAHLRQVAKYPESINPDIELDGLSTQLLMVTDAVNFYRTILMPKITEGINVLADRCNPISMMAYGLAEGLSPLDIHRLLSIMNPPKPDRLYILKCDPSVAYERMRTQNGGDKMGLDRFERKGMDFMLRLSKVYDSLANCSDIDCEILSLVNQAVHLDNIRYLDATLPPARLARQVFVDLQDVLAH
jgi:dTMP kinase